jgi:hypothetical protein
MDDWDGFYALAGSTAGTLIGLIFVVITLGIDHTQKGDEHRVRLFVTPARLFPAFWSLPWDGAAAFTFHARSRSAIGSAGSPMS